MPKISVLIIEDEELFADKMEMQLEKLGFELTGICDNAEAALQKIKTSLPDLILMDINIQGEYDGIELADLIHQKQNIPILFITSLKDDLTFRRAARTNPVGFLLKPFNEIQLRRSIELIIKKLDKKPTAESKDLADPVFTKNHFFIKNKQQLEKVKFEDILYIEADGRYSKIFTKKKKYLLRKPFQDLLNALSDADFVQSHRSFALNLNFVERVDLFEMVVHLADFQLPLSKRNKEAFLERLDRI